MRTYKWSQINQEKSPKASTSGDKHAIVHILIFNLFHHFFKKPVYFF